VIKNLQKEIYSLKGKYNEFFQDSSTDRLIPNFSRVPEVGIEFTRLQRQLEYYVKVLEYLAPEYESSKIEESKNIPTIEILDQAVRPERKDKPKRSLFVLAALALSFIFSLYVIYWREVLKVKLKSTDLKS
jgi:uncharacterized protein involved in exopolysaccharide biosynthesis